MIDRREFTDTLMRSTRWKWNGCMVIRHREPEDGVDPYAVGFDQHDPANYTTISWHVIVALTRRLKVTLEVRPRGVDFASALWRR
jgi:hypothetical protein